MRASTSFALGVAAMLVAGPQTNHAIAGGPVDQDSLGSLVKLGDAELDAFRAAGVGDVTSNAQTDAKQQLSGVTLNVTGGSVNNGAVTLGGNALSSFSGINTQAFSTGMGNNVLATTTLSIVLRP